MKKAIAFLHERAEKTTFLESFVNACKQKDIDVKLVLLDSAYYRHRGKILWSTYRNILTWGIKWEHKEYISKSRNVVFVEHTQLSQRTGWSFDASGLYKDSRFCKEKLWNSVIVTKEKERELREFIKKQFNFNLLKGGDKNGPLLITLQHDEDAPVRNYFERSNVAKPVALCVLELVKTFINKDIPIIVRPHPLFIEEWNKIENLCIPLFNNNWSLSKSGSVYKIMKRCRGLITINSTTACEALALGIPVATLGSNIYSGSGLILECAPEDGYNYDRLKLMNDYYEMFRGNGAWNEVIKDLTIKFLYTLMKHKMPMYPTTEDFIKNEDFNIWVNRAHNDESNKGGIREDVPHTLDGKFVKVDWR